MIGAPAVPTPPFFAPEVIQTSAMDCGPAVLKCLLEGFGIRVSYGRLREACQTDVDGTSIDTLEEIARQLGLNVQQTIMPQDHLVTPAAELLPALVVVLLPDGSTHFVVAWRLHGPWIQVMDPGTGRRWYRHQRFLSEVYRHQYAYPAILWRAWAGSNELIAPLRQRLMKLGLEPLLAQSLIDGALEEAGWQPIAALDAAARMTASIVQTGYLRRGEAAHHLLTHLLQQALNENPDETPAIPEGFWSIRPDSQADMPPSPGAEQVTLQGAVLLRVRGRLAAAPSRSATAVSEWQTAPATSPLPPNLAAALAEPPPQPLQQLWQLIRAHGLATPIAAVFAVGLTAAGTALQAPLLQGLMILAPEMLREGRRLDLLALVLSFLLCLLLLDGLLFSNILLMGRRLEAQLRLAFLSKIPRLGDRYFYSRLTSDMAQRAYSLRQIRMLPLLGFQGLALACQLLFTTIGICWFAPTAAPIAFLTLGLMFAVGLLAQPVITQADLRARTHDGALSRFHLDALQGLIPLRTHSAERALRREHEDVLREWVRSSWSLTQWQVAAQTLAMLIGFSGAIGIIFTYLASRGDPHEVLLLLFWSLQLPGVAQSMLQLAQQYPGLRNIVLRLLEPLGAPDEEPTADVMPASAQAPVETDAQAAGVAIDMEAVVVSAAGRTILSGIDLHIEPGEHVAIVGASGAGKSSLVGLLLGWHQPAEGQIRIDGESLDGAQVAALRRVTAWLDPAVHLWNRSLEDNLYYGVYQAPAMPLALAIQRAELDDVLASLPNALQSYLGESGGLVSGGEGQRVRLGRALLRPGVRLAILDEPFRGLDHNTRRELLNNAREQWRDATLICIMHDVLDTQGFTRVVVIDEGRIVEDAAPAVLAAQPDSYYSRLLAADEAVQTSRWQSTVWRRLRLEDGYIHEG